MNPCCSIGGSIKRELKTQRPPLGTSCWRVYKCQCRGTIKYNVQGHYKQQQFLLIAAPSGCAGRWETLLMTGREETWRVWASLSGTLILPEERVQFRRAVTMLGILDERSSNRSASWYGCNESIMGVKLRYTPQCTLGALVWPGAETPRGLATQENGWVKRKVVFQVLQ